VSDTYKIVYSKVINRAIRDLVGSQHQERDDALKYMKSQAFIEHCRIAGYPEALQDALDEMVLLSSVEQKIVAELVMEELNAS
jgi:hypothetical protein